jgi:hypothetical protein
MAKEKKPLDKDVKEVELDLGLETTSIADADVAIKNPQLKATVIKKGDIEIINHPIAKLKKVEYGIGNPYKKQGVFKKYFGNTKIAFLYLTFEGINIKQGLAPQHRERFSSFLSKDKVHSNLLFIEDNCNKMFKEIFETMFDKDINFITNIEKEAANEFNKALLDSDKYLDVIDGKATIKEGMKAEVTNLRDYYKFKNVANTLNKLIAENEDSEQTFSLLITVRENRFELKNILPFYKTERTIFKGQEGKDYDIIKTEKPMAVVDDIGGGIPDAFGDNAAFSDDMSL